MRTDAAVAVLAVVAVRAQDLEAGRESRLLQSPVSIQAGHAAIVAAVGDDTTMIGAIVPDMIDRQEHRLGLATAGALIAAVGLKHLVLQLAVLGCHLGQQRRLLDRVAGLRIGVLAHFADGQRLAM